LATCLTFTWGVVCVLTGITQNFPGFLAARFFIGVIDSGLWYKRNERIYAFDATLTGFQAFGIAKAF
jgi:hypothetical protein